jgi:hypothetical protein
MEIIYDEFNDVFDSVRKIELSYEHKFIDKAYIDYINSMLTDKFFKEDKDVNKKLFWSVITYKGEKHQLFSDFSPDITGDNYYGKMFKIIPEWLLEKINSYMATSITSVLLDKEFNKNQISITFDSVELKRIYEGYILENWKAETLRLFKKIKNFKGGYTTSIFNDLDKISQDLKKVDLGSMIGNIFKGSILYNKLNFFFFSYFLTAIQEDATFEKSIEVEKVDYFCLFPRSHMADSFKGIYVVSFKSLGRREKELLVNNKFSNFKLLLYYLLSVDFSKKIRIDNRIIRVQSLKSAIGAIMSRNMSHNIGSHVLADLVAKMDYKSKEELSHFFRYMQNRMDFIAQITTDFPEWTYPAYFNKELMKIFFENYILLDRIGVSEGLAAYEWPKDWKKGDMRSKIIVRTCLAQRKGKSTPDPQWVINEYHMGKLSDDLQLAIPGGIVGYHAFYIIIENIIRNSAKHDYAARTEDWSDNENKNHSVDEIVYIEKGCNTWVISPTAKDRKLTRTEDLVKKVKSCKALIIDSSCIKVTHKTKDDQTKDNRDFIEHKQIELIDGTSLEIPGEQKLFILCEDKPKDCNFTDAEGCCNCCLVVTKDFWQKKRPYYQVIAKKEVERLEEETNIPSHNISENKAERFNNILNFLRKGPLRINIRVDDMIDKDYVWFTIWDNMRHYIVTNFDKLNDVNDEVSGNVSEDQMKKRVLDESKISEAEREKEYDYKSVNLFGYMNDRLRQSFIKEIGELKREDWGLAELKICAGFLQNRQVEEIGGEGKKLIRYGTDCFNLDAEYEIEDVNYRNNGCPQMLIKALPVDRSGQIFESADGAGKESSKELKLKEGDVYYLGFRFWMKKPKTVTLARYDTKQGENGNG